MRLLAIWLVIFASCWPTSAAEPQSGDQVRVLLVTGVDYEGHHWRETAPAIRNVLMKDKRFDVRIVEDPDFLASPAVGNYDVIFLHFKNYAPLPHEAAARRIWLNLLNKEKDWSFSISRAAHSRTGPSLPTWRAKCGTIPRTTRAGRLW